MIDIATFAANLARDVSGSSIISFDYADYELILDCRVVMIPRHEMLTGDTLHGVVTPHADRTEPAVRGGMRSVSYDLDLGLIKVCKESEIPNLLRLAHDVRDRLLWRKLGGFTCMSSVSTLLYSPEVWLETGAFLSVITMNWKAYENVRRR